jgi:hypothetical protein
MAVSLKDFDAILGWVLWCTIRGALISIIVT